MTHFLEVGFMREGLQEVLDNALRLRQLLMMSPEQRSEMENARVQQGDLTTYADDVRATLQTILEQAENMADFLDRFDSAPLIYTGDGSTAEVMSMLERLLVQSQGSQKP